MSSIVGDISNFFSGVFRPVTNVISGGINTVSSIPQDIENFGNTVSKVFGNFLTFLKSIPGDLLSIMDQIGIDAVNSLNIFGAWIHSAFGTLGSAIFGALKVASAPIIDAVQFIVKNIPVVLSFITSLYTDVRNFLGNVYNGFVNTFSTAFTIINDSISLITNFLSFAPTLFSNFSHFLEDSLNFVTEGGVNLVSGASAIYSHYTDSAPFDVLKQETSRFAKTTNRLLGYNTAMEVMKSTIRRSWLTQNMSPLTRALFMIGSPLIAGFTGLMAENFFNAFYPDSQLSTTQSYTPPVLPTTVFAHHTTHVQPPTFAPAQYNAQISPALPSPSPLQIGQFKPGHIISVYIRDLITLTGFTVTGGLVSASQFAQLLSDTLNLDYNLLLRIVPLFTVDVTDLMTPVLSSSITTATATQSDNVYVTALAQVGGIAIPLGSSLCSPPGTPPTNSYGEVTVDNVDVDYSICVNINQAVFSIMDMYITTALPTPNVPTTVVDLFISTVRPPPNVPTTSLGISITTAPPTPNLPSETVSININLQYYEVQGSTTVLNTLVVNGEAVTTKFGSVGDVLNTTFKPSILIQYS